MKLNRRNTIIFILAALFIHLFFFSSAAAKKHVTIAVTKTSPNYVNWLKRADTSVVILDMYNLSLNEAVKKLETCSGLLITGGEDILPAFYHKPELEKYCQDSDVRRDSLEIALIEKAFSMKMPVFGICRGEQILNVALGGTLIADIPKYFADQAKLSGPKNNNQTSDINRSKVLHQCEDYLKCYHAVHVVPGTLLSSILASGSGSVASNHHQAVETLAPGIRCNARSEDGLTEGIEWQQPAGKSFMIGVQWHPERMENKNDFSGKLLQEFFLQVIKYSDSQKTILK